MITPEGNPGFTTAYCHGDICKQPRVFKYDGPQTARGKRVYDHYTCTVCHGTESFNHTPEWLEARKSKDALVKLIEGKNEFEEAMEATS